MADFDPGTGLGPRLRLVRGSRQLSVRELARRVGCSASLISQIERGISVPSVGVLYSLATELGSSLDYLLFGSGAGLDGVSVVEAGSAEAGPAGAGPAGAGPAGAGPAVDAGPAGAAEAWPAVDAGPAGAAEPRGAPDETSGTSASGASSVFGTSAVSGASGVFGVSGSAPPSAIVQRGCDRRIIDLASGVRWERLTRQSEAMTDFLEVIYSPGGHSTDERRPLRHDGREYGLIVSGTLQANVGFESYELGPGDSIAFDSSTPHEYLNKTGDYVHAIWVVVHSEPGRA
jgi:mannose-6-phosphate isomerase-like protein (cupin superfamily)/DNA-binding XRE family transcriptional regulator